MIGTSKRKRNKWKMKKYHILRKPRFAKPFRYNSIGRNF